MQISEAKTREQRIGRRSASAVVASMLCVVLAACAPIPAPPQQSVFPSPVAFVTPAPPPRPTVTPTQPPVAAPTQPPPTVIPKKFPIDSTAAIGLWGDRIDPTKPFTGFLDLAAGPAAEAMAQTNIVLVTLNGRQAYYGFGKTLTDTRATKPTWLLYDKDGKVALASDTREPLLNIREADVRELIANDVAQLTKDYDGIVVDGVGNDLIRANNTPVFTGTKAFTDQQRRDAAESLIRSLRAAAPNKLLVIGGYAWADGTAYAARTTESQDLAGVADGVHISNWLRVPLSGTKDFKTEANWKKDVDYLSAISADNKVVLLTTRLPVSPTSDIAEQWLNYSVASYLLGKNGARTYFQFDANGTLSTVASQLLNTPIGAPLEAYAKSSSGVYQRKFANGIVLVNPTDKTQSVELDTEYKTLSGAKVKKVTLASDNGIVLLKP